MPLSQKTFESTLPGRELAEAYLDRTADQVRAGARRASARLVAARRPTRRLTQAALDLAALSHATLSKLLQQQGSLLEAALDRSGHRLARLAKAPNWREALAAPSAEDPAITLSARRNFRKTMTILAEAGRDASRLLGAAYAELKPGSAVRALHRRSARTRAKARPAGARRRKPSA